MRKIMGPAVFLAQFLRDEAPFNSLRNIGKWVSELGYKGVQIPTWDARVFNLDQASSSQSYCNELKDQLQEQGLQPTELAAHLQGQVLAMNHVYKTAFSAFYPSNLNDSEIIDWAGDQLCKTIQASANLGLKTIPVMSGGFAWHMIYPWPQRPPGLVKEAFQELAKRWKPVLDLARDLGQTIAYELHPGSDIHDGATFEMFLDAVKDHPGACINYDPSHFVLQQLDYCHFIQLYGERITAFHVKDAEFRPNGRVGVYGGYQDWAHRAGRFRSPGDGQVDFKRVFTLLTEAGYTGWAVLEWECCIKSPEQGAREGAPFIESHIIEATNVAFDDFAGGESHPDLNRKILGLDS
ncbi:sugar phosphate isomerase/epimerase [bacterium]|nr:sugar phosphate isomerase/epimerase [bacterium]